MRKDNNLYLGHMLDMSRKAMSLIAGKTREDYDHDETLRLALTHLLQVIGEAAGRLSRDFCDSQPQVPWSAIVGMRHKVVHDYMDVDEDIVWDTVQEELPPLVVELEKIVTPL
jgi:uncharacterized protein with HEPN domain